MPPSRVLHWGLSCVSAGYVNGRWHHVFGTRSHVAQTSLELAMRLRMTFELVILLPLLLKVQGLQA